MKVKLDENMPTALAGLLRDLGHDPATVAEEGLGDVEDPKVLDAATSEERILMTFDVGLGNIREFPIGSHGGIVVFRLHDQRWAVLQQPARRLVTSGVLDRLHGGVAVVDEARVRLRTSHRASDVSGQG